MLYLSRKAGESIIINNNVTLTVVDIKSRSVKLGFTFPRDASVLRAEVHARIAEENTAALESDGALLGADIAPDAGGDRPEPQPGTGAPEPGSPDDDR